jgi:hypothetical protein
MTGAGASASPRHAAGGRSTGGAALCRVADGLRLAAAPAFALMASVSHFYGGQTGMPCAAMPGASALGGMTAMYLLMSVFHLPRWLTLASARTAPDREGRAGDM